MKLQHKPQKGWKYRVIIAEENGKYLYDDVTYEHMVPILAERMVRTLRHNQENPTPTP